MNGESPVAGLSGRLNAATRIPPAPIGPGDLTIDDGGAPRTAVGL